MEKKIYTLLLIGLDGAGKTTLVKQFGQPPTVLHSFYSNKKGELIPSTPFLNLEQVNLPTTNYKCAVLDLSGQARYRPTWGYFYPEVDGIFFVVDTTDRERLSMVRDLLAEVMYHHHLVNRQIPFLILANKQDLSDSLTKVDLKRLLHIEQMKINSKLLVSIKETSAKNGFGINNCFEFFEANKNL